MSDYCCPGRRKSKNDRRAKARFARYKRGGGQRSANIVLSNTNQDSSDNSGKKN